MKYVANQYGPEKSFIREEVAKQRFIVEAHGSAWFDEDDPRYGQYSSRSSVHIATAETLTEVLETVERLVSESYGEFGNAIDRIAVESIDCNSFSEKYFLIYDRSMLVATLVNEKSVWQFQPLLTGDDAEAAFVKADELLKEARVESGWDNFSTAQSLRDQAMLLCYQIETNITNRSKGFLNEMHTLMAQQQIKIENRMSELLAKRHAQ